MGDRAYWIKYCLWMLLGTGLFIAAWLPFAVFVLQNAWHLPRWVIGVAGGSIGGLFGQAASRVYRRYHW
jgi:hypothetical protein